MRKDTFFAKLFSKFIPVFSVIMLYSFCVSGMGDDNVDDVSEMITTVGKQLHQIFVIDSSESMNSFAYSDYIDVCNDAESNLQKALNLCENAYNQCRNVESNAMCDVDLNCGDITTKCNTIKTTRTKIRAKCTVVANQFKEPGRDQVIAQNANYGEGVDKTYVGPWDPKQFYTQDICFYDWTADTNGDVPAAYEAMEDPNKTYHGASEQYNKEKYCAKHGKTGAACDSAFQDFIDKSGGFIAERRDWDCITNGSGKMSNGANFPAQGLSGLWLNWKYATSLDAVKIILADTHQFSFPPRTRGESLCYKTNYYPYQEYQDAVLCTEEDVAAARYNCGGKEAGYPVECSADDVANHLTENNNCEDENYIGQQKFIKKKACIVASFIPDLSNISDPDQRKTQLESIRDSVESSWEAEYKATPDSTPVNERDTSSDDPLAVKNSYCTSFDIKTQFATNNQDTVSSDDCDKCLKWTVNGDGTGSFVEVGCSNFVSQDTVSPEDTLSRNLDTVAVHFDKECCKTAKCDNPKCRDNDMCCKDNSILSQATNPEAYKICVEGSYSCVLEYYSEYDQDANHCCNKTECAETGDTVTGSDGCQSCETGSVLGSDVEEASTAIVPILTITDPTNPSSYCGSSSSEDSCEAIAVTVGLGSDSTIDFTDVSSVKLSVYYDCADSTADHPANSLGSGVCTNAADCESVVSGELSGCADKGYRMEAQIVVTRSGCNFGPLDVNLKVKYRFDDGYKYGTYSSREVFELDKPLYHLYNSTTKASTDKVYEYECKTSFYNREYIVRSGSSCPSANDAPIYINSSSDHQGDKVEYCSARSAERDVIARDQWGTPTKVACSWLCRAAETYDDPWKCSAYFFMMDSTDQNGNNFCNDECRNGMTTSDQIERCCRCVNKEQGQFAHHKNPDGVDMSSRVSQNPDPWTGEHLTGSRATCAGNHCVCAVSDYKTAEASDGSIITVTGYQAEIVNGHVKEGGTDGYYNLSPYSVQDGVLWTPYLTEELADIDDPGTGGWYGGRLDPVTQKVTGAKLSLTVSETGQAYLGRALTSLFTTNNSAARKPVCIFDILWGFSGEDCGGSCGNSCCSIDLGDKSTNCNYPTFWMQMPDSDGGRLLGEGENGESLKDNSICKSAQEADPGKGMAMDLTKSCSKEIFRREVKKLKAIGGSTLGETLYDVWRYLGGMYALHDPGHTLKAYVSPFDSGADPRCYSNEAIIISGGNPQFDDNYELNDKAGVACTGDNDPCVVNTETTISQAEPYIKYDEWSKTSLQKVAKFVNTQTFWGTEECRKGEFSSSNAKGCPYSDTSDAGTPLIDRVHTIAIGEWALSAMYHSLSNEEDSELYLDESLIKDVAESTSGKYYTLTATENYNPTSGTSEGGTFVDISTLFQKFVDQETENNVKVGRPHWTSSLVQPFDVEEKYRGPEAYTAGAIPVSSKASRFWFGNLKRYNVDGGTDCPISDDTEASCGEWKKQTFDAQDCFAPDDAGTSGFSGNGTDGGNSTLDAFKKLMVGGAAYRLADKLGSACDELPCFRNTPRQIYYDLGIEGQTLDLKNANIAQLRAKLERFNPSITEPQTQQIFDYMAGYDAFAETNDDRKKVRFSDSSNNYIEVPDPFNIDFTGSDDKMIKIRPLLLGAIVHSKPLAVYYDDNSTTRIYVGANDGMLHSFDQNGEEVYAYVPSLAFGSIVNFANEGSDKISFNPSVDGPISILHIDQSHDGIINNGEKAFLIFGYRRGWYGYTVIDISNKDQPKFVQNINTDGGYSFGKAVVFRKCSGTCSYAEDLDYYIAVPGGYDSCHDPVQYGSKVTSHNTVSCEVSNLRGNMFKIYKFDDDNNKFAEVVKFGLDTESDSRFEKSSDKLWFVTSFASVPFVVNTSGKAAVNTEFIYFTDLSGTVFRVDVRENNTSKWKTKIVFSKRKTAGIETNDWQELNRTFTAANFYPPLERYNPARTTESDGQDWLIPIPIVTGNAANPRYIKQEGLVVFYDQKDQPGSYTNPSSTDLMINNAGTSHATPNTMIDDRRGWRVQFNISNGEKGITEPLIVYDIYGGGSTAESTNSYSIAWNTYIPDDDDDCVTFGTSSNYERYVPDGAQAFKDTTMTGARGEWTVSEDSSGKCIDGDNKNISLATSVGIIATKDGYDLTFGAGADIFRKEKLTVKKNSTYIIKWYELY